MKQSTNIQPVFDRGRSGYVRDFNTIDVFIFNVIGFALGLALSTNPPFIGSFAPSANIFVVLGLGAVLALFNGLTYGWFGGIMPSTGGDYIFVGRSLSHRLGFLTSWGFTACQVYGLALNLGFLLSVGIAPAMTTLGISTGYANLVIAGTSLVNPQYIAVGSVGLVLIYFLLAYLEIGVHRLVIYGAFGVALLGPLLMITTLFAHSHTDFVSAFNSFMEKFNGTPDAYQLAIATAKESGMTIDPKLVWQSSLQAMPLGFLCFLGFTYSVYVGGEVREPQTSQIRGILFALGLGCVVFLVGMGLYVKVVGQEFHSAVGFPSVSAKLGLPGNSSNLFVGMLAPNPVFNAIMQVGNFLWFLLVPYVIIQVCAHNLIAWTCDHMMPERLLSRAGRANAPWLALLAICAATLVCIGANYFFGFTLVGAVALAAFAFCLTGISAVYLPKQRPEIFAKAPSGLQRRIFGVTLFQLVGLVGAVGFAYVIFVAIWYPDIAGGTRVRAIVVLIVVYVTGLVAYEINKGRLRRRVKSVGVDLDALFREIPKD